MNLQNQLKKAHEFAKLGNFNEAKITLQKVLKKFPHHFDAIVSCGYIELQKNNPNNAKNFFFQALNLKKDLKLLDNLSELLKNLQAWDEIIDLKEKYNSTSIIFLINYAIALRQKNNKDESLSILKELYEKNINNINIFISYGFTLNYFEFFDRAIEIYEEGLRHYPGNYFLNYNLGIAYANNELPDSSIEYLKKSIKQNPQNFNAWITLAAQQIKRRYLDEAKESIEKCKIIDPDNSLIILQSGVIHMKNGDLENAKKELKKFIQLEPENPDGNYHLGLCLLYEQNFKEASIYYKFRTKTRSAFGRFDDMHLPILTQKSNILIGWEQGIGDQLLFLRLLPSFLKKYNNVTYISTNKLYELTKNTFSNITVVRTSECEDLILNSKEYIKLNLGSLIHYESDVENAIKLSKNLIIKNKYKFEKSIDYNKKKIGLSWSSQNKSIGNEKSISLREFESVLKIPNMSYINLQYGDIFSEIAEIENKLNVCIYYDHNLDYFDDLTKLAALVNECDYVITTSNVTAHIAGSLGVKTFVLVPKSHGKLWYWFSKNDKCIWYPSIKIIHQEEDGVWYKEIEKIKKLISS